MACDLHAVHYELEGCVGTRRMLERRSTVSSASMLVILTIRTAVYGNPTDVVREHMGRLGYVFSMIAQQ
jgi:hypothetical protein